MAVVQDGAATAARAGKPLCAAAVSVSAVCRDLRWYILRFSDLPSRKSLRRKAITAAAGLEPPQCR